MPTYSASLTRHLAAYKVARLGVREAGVFIHQGREVRHAHVLPRELKWLNILEPIRAEVQAFVEARPTLRLHKYFHHLNSSQAFALNLFFPYFQGDASARLLNAMGLPDALHSWEPELVPDDKEGTNVDIAWTSASGAWTYCEVKLSEQEFGTAIGGERHQAKLTDIYAPALRPHCSPELLQPARFFAQYQIFRNLWLAAREPNASIVFLLPERNEALWEPLQAIKVCLRPDLAKRVHTVSIESVLRALSSDPLLDARLRWYAELLAEKYVPTELAG